MEPIAPEQIELFSNAILVKGLEFGIQFCLLAGVVIGLVKSWRIGKLEELALENKDNIANIKVSVDGNLTAMLEMQKKLSFAAGQKQEVDDEADRKVASDVRATVTVPVQNVDHAVTEVTPQPGQELKIRAEAATVETDKDAPKGSGDLIITADVASVESQGKGNPKGKQR